MSTEHTLATQILTGWEQKKICSNYIFCDDDRIPVIEFDRMATDEENEMCTLYLKFKEFKKLIYNILGLDELGYYQKSDPWHLNFETLKTILNFDWNTDKIYELYPEIEQLKHVEILNTTIFEIILQQLKELSIHRIKANGYYIDIEPQNTRFMFYDPKRKAFYSTLYLPCSWCSFGAISAFHAVRCRTLIPYCGCQDTPRHQDFR